MEKFNYALHEQQRSRESEKFITRRMVIKIGSSTITGGTDTLDVNFMENIARQISVLVSQGVEVMIVTSGAVASGKKELIAAAASMFGQTKLMGGWADALKASGVGKEDIGHLLLTDNHLVDGIGDVLRDALRCGIVIVNGQDAVNDLSDSIICKDNDRLAGTLVKLVGADTLLLLTDKDGVLDKDGKTIETFDSTTEIVIFSEHKGVSNGGIASKIRVAREFAGRVIIANGRSNDVILKVAQGKKVGTEVRSNQASFFHLL